MDELNIDSLEKNPDLSTLALWSSLAIVDPALSNNKAFHFKIASNFERLYVPKCLRLLPEQITDDPKYNDQLYIIFMAILHYLVAGYPGAAKRVFNSLNSLPIFSKKRLPNIRKYRAALKDIEGLLSYKYPETFYTGSVKVKNLIDLIALNSNKPPEVE